MFVVAYTTNDRQVYHGFVYSVDFAKFFNRDKFCQQCINEDLSALVKICQVVTNHPHL